MDLAIVIPCLNEEAYIGGLLENINLQTILPKYIVVADCNSTDKTVAVARGFKSKVPVQVLTAPYQSASSARNAGASKCNTERVLFLDADTRIPNNFIEEFSKNEFDIQSPRFKSSGKHPFDVFNVFVLNLWLCRSIYLLRKPKVIGAALMVNRGAHLAVGGFDEKIREFDDIKYAAKFNHGYSFGYSWNAKAKFSNRRFVKQGRIKTFIQQLPDHNIIVRKFIRPLMKKFGVNDKFDN